MGQQLPSWGDVIPVKSFKLPGPQSPHLSTAPQFGRQLSPRMRPSSLRNHRATIYSHCTGHFPRSLMKSSPWEQGREASEVKVGGGDQYPSFQRTQLNFKELKALLSNHLPFSESFPSILSPLVATSWVIFLQSQLQILHCLLIREWFSPDLKSPFKKMTIEYDSRKKNKKEKQWVRK